MSYPPFGTALIKCGKSACDFVGLETDLIPKAKNPTDLHRASVCPKCGCTYYDFVNDEHTKEAKNS